MMRRRPGDVAALGTVLACCAVVGVVLFWSRAMPTLGDYGEWTYHGVLLRDVLLRHANPMYGLKHYPVPNSLTTVGLGVLMLVLPWKVAAKCWLMCEVLLGAWCGYKLHRAADDRRVHGADLWDGGGQAWRLLVLPGAVLFGITFWAGFTNFMFGTYLAMLLASMLLRGVESRWTYGVLLVLLFFSHMIPFGFAMLLVVTFAVEWQRWRVALQSIPALLLCGWYFAARVVNGNVDGHAGMVASVPYLSRMFWVFKANSYLKCWGFLNPAMGERDSVALQVLGTKIFVLLFALNAVVALLLLGMMVKSVLRSMGEWRGDGFFWVSVAVFAAAGCLMPGAAAGISDPGGRMLQVAVWCGLCAAPARAMWTGMVAATCGVVLMTANAVLLGSVAMRPPVMGETGGMLPARVRQFGHVYYADRWQYPIAVESGRMDLEIYPTAMFLKRDAGGR